jgi:hypothetical protein
MAELISLPAYEQLRVLTEQKYPKQTPQSFRTPFYAPALTAIREYYRKDRDPAVIAQAKNDLGQLGLKARIENNLRVLASFEKGEQAKRAIVPVTNPRIRAAVGSLELKLSADMRGTESKSQRITFYNCRTAPIEQGIAESALNLADWVFKQNEEELPIRSFEFVDLYWNSPDSPDSSLRCTGLRIAVQTPLG